MPGTLLIGGPTQSWRDWLLTNRKGRDLIVLDPADTAHGPAGRLLFIHGDEVPDWRFFGSLNPLRSPQAILAALAVFLRTSESPVIQLFRYTPSPILRNIVQTVADVSAPDEIFMSEDCDLTLDGWPVGPMCLPTTKDFPEMVLGAQRKAHWLKLIEQSEPDRLLLRQVAIHGSRLGSGRLLSAADRQQLGLEATLHVEQCGATLFIVGHEEPKESAMTRALDLTHCSRGQVVHPEAYNDLLCSLARQDGTDFAYGMVRKIDFVLGVIEVVTTAVPPAPARTVRLGGLRVDDGGREVEELMPWRV